jgi:hypothetical protein
LAGHATDNAPDDFPKSMTERKKTPEKRPKRGQKVVLKALPPGFLDGLPDEDQRAISAMVGKPIMLNKYDRDGRAELEFADPYIENSSHTIWVDPKFIKVR